MLEGGDAPDEGDCVSFLNCSCLLCAQGLGGYGESPRPDPEVEISGVIYYFQTFLECSLEEDSEG